MDVERFDLDPTRPLFHGLAGRTVDSSKLKGLSTEDKGPFVMDVLEQDQVSTKLLASLIEVDQSIVSWPQLARDVSLGASLVSATIHRLFSDPTSVLSGRSCVDLSSSVTNLEDPLLRESDRQLHHDHRAFTVRDPLPTDGHDVIESMYIGAGLALSLIHI